MLTTLTRTFAALGLSLVIGLGALGASATPARADADDAARIIGGIIALYAIGRALEGNRNSGHAVQQHPHIPPRNLRVAPARCFIEGHDPDEGYFRGYVRRCMINNVPRPALLPNRCLRQVLTHRGYRNIYGGRCLFRNGWVREAGFGH